MSLVGFKAQNHPQQARKDNVDDRGTTPELFAEISEQYGPFTVDVAAAAHNTKCEHFYSIEDDGLAQSWAGELVWCNPPYSDIPTWVGKAWRERQRAQRIVMLLPANRTEQAWWQDSIEPYRRCGELKVEFLRGRRRFIRSDRDAVEPNDRPPFGVCIVIWESAG